MGGITFSPVSSVSPPAGAPIGARNGLSIDAGGFAVLGQDVLASGNPGALLSAREIPQATFGINLFGGGVEFSQSRRAALAFGLGIHFDTPGSPGASPLRIGTTLHDYFLVDSQGIISLNDINTGINCIQWKGQRFIATPLPSATNSANSINSRWEPDATVDPAVINDLIILSRVNLNNVADVEYTGIKVQPSVLQSPVSNGKIHGIVYSPFYPGGPLAFPSIGLDIQTGDVLLNSDLVAAGQLSRVGMQGVTSPTAYLEIGAGVGAPGTGQVKLDPGTILAAPEQGVLELDAITTNLFFTRIATQETVLMGNAAAAPGTTVTPVFTSFYGGNTVAMGKPVNWVAVNIAGTAFKIPLYT